MHINTRLLHNYPVIDEATGAASIAIHQTSTFHQADIAQQQDYTYTRFGNPTVSCLEECIAALEQARYGLAFSSGMAAINAVLFLLKQGDHLVLGENIYGGTFQMVTDILPDLGVTCTFVDESDPQAWELAIQENTAMFYLETPSNPLLTITDITSVCRIAKKHGILTACDNTFMTPLSQHPIELGVDIVIHSATKFINGHSDVVAGLLALNDDQLYEKLKKLQKALGGILAPQDAWLTLRGVKTLGLRMERSVENAEKLSAFLGKRNDVRHVYYPALPEHPNRNCHLRQAENGGAVLSFELASADAVCRFFDALTIPIAAVSLGGVESIVSYPWTMSHAIMPEEKRLAMGVTPNLVRLSCGIEDADDLITDFAKALAIAHSE